MTAALAAAGEARIDRRGVATVGEHDGVAPLRHVVSFGRTARWPLLIVALSLAGVVLFPPRALLVTDEGLYASQAIAFARGQLTIGGAHYLGEGASTASDYPPGTAALQAPFVFLGGDWRAARYLSPACLLLATLVTIRWLRDAGHEPGFAIAVTGFLGTLVFTRLATSDVPSLAFVATAQWMLWTGAGRGWRWNAAAGFIAASTVLLRETNLLLVAPFVVGNVWRHRRDGWPLAMGAAAGIALRLAVAGLLFGSPFYLRYSGDGFALAHVGRNLLTYGVMLNTLVPVGGVALFAYRGERRPEVLAASGAYLSTYLLYGGNGGRSGTLKGLVLASRFLLPLLPLVAIAVADASERWLGALSTAARTRAARIGVTWIAATAACAVVVPVLLHRAELGAWNVVQFLHRAIDGRYPVITNAQATEKYLSPVLGPLIRVRRDDIAPSEVADLVERFGGATVAFLDRTDSDFFRRDAAENERFVHDVGSYCATSPALVERPGEITVRVLAVRDCRR